MGDDPAHLATFTPEDWPGRTVEDKVARWGEARRAYADVNGWPGGGLALISGWHDEQQRRAGEPLWSWGRTARELAELTGQPYDHRSRDV